MAWYHYVSYFFGGLLLTNAIPHLVSGLMGRSFQTPFARPRGQGHSSAMANIWWGSFNVAIGYLLLCRVGTFDLRNTEQVLVAGLPALVGGVLMARHFGRFNGGNSPLSTPQAIESGRASSNAT